MIDGIVGEGVSIELGLIIILIVLVLVDIAVTVLVRHNRSAEHITLDEEFRKNREENNLNAQHNRKELTDSFDKFRERLEHDIRGYNDGLRRNFDDFSKQQALHSSNTIGAVKDVRSTIEKQLSFMRNDNNAQLEEMRKTVDEKLQKTLSDRLTQSFAHVSKDLQSVQEGLGEMKNLAQDVGGLKNVLSNVKARGTIGEYQLEMLLDQILSPQQYAKNVRPNVNSSQQVEFAIKLPGKGGEQDVLWLPIDSKFPLDRYQQLVDSYESGDKTIIEKARKEFSSTVKQMAKEIHDKYIVPPFTTDFAILYVPFEAVYSEIIRDVSLHESLQRELKVMVNGPTVLGAYLNSLQIGFKTLAIEKRSSDVWKILGSVKKEFGNFSGIMQKAQKNIQTGLGQLDEVMGVRTRAIEKQLVEVETLDDTSTKNLLDDIGTDTRSS